MDITAYLPSRDEYQPRKVHSVQIILPGEVITDEPTAMRGHGTYLLNDKLIASVSGIVERVGKLVSVRPFKSRYIGETGDIVVGRVLEIGPDRWKLDINARQDAILLLGAVNLHGGIHRRRNTSDTLKMRDYFVENDIVVADVQSTYQDGSIALHVSQSLGKFTNGILLVVRHSLVKRVKTPIYPLECGISIILGNNGYIWIMPSITEEEEQERIAMGDKWAPKPIPAPLRQNLSRIRNSISILDQRFMPIGPDHIMEIYFSSLKYEVKDMLKIEVVEQLIKGI